MHPDELLEAVRREAGALAAAAVELEAPVPACPGWDIRQLLNHMGRVQRWVTTIVANPSQERPPFPPRPPVIDVAWFTEGAEELVGALDAAGPEAPAWTFFGPGQARFWFRRQAVETALHRWDAEGALGEPQPLDTELAVTGVDEALDVLLAGRPADLGGSVHFHATDSPHGEWTVRRAPDGTGLLVGHGHDKGDVALRGSAGDLLLWLWGRQVPAGRLEVFGDEAVLGRWSQSLKIG